MLCCAGSPAPKEKVSLDPRVPRFTVSIDRQPGEPLGITFDSTRCEDRVQITKVILGGPVADFNAQSQGVQVQAGDWIEQVNQATDSKGMAETLQSGNKLTIKMMKSWAKLQKGQKKKKGVEDKGASPDKQAPGKKERDPSPTATSAPAPSPTATNGQAPVAKKEEEKKEVEATPKGPKLTVNMNGTWVSESMEESDAEMDTIMKDLGVPWVARKALKAAGWGKGMTKFKLTVTDEKANSESIAPNKSNDDFYFGKGWQPYVDEKGIQKQCLAEVLDDGKGYKLSFKTAGKLEVEMWYMINANGKLRMPIKSADGKRLPTTIFKRE